MKIITSKYTICAWALITFALCFFPMQSGRLTEGEAYTAVIEGVGFTEFSAPSIVILIAPLIVLAILYGCQSRQAKEVELILLLIGNSICFVHGANAARAWLLEIDAVIYGMTNIALFVYPVAFALLCFIAIIKNTTDKEVSNEKARIS